MTQLYSDKAAISHIHDDRYYVEEEINGWLNLLFVNYDTTNKYTRSPVYYGTSVADALAITHPGFVYTVNPNTANLPYSGCYGLLVIFIAGRWRWHIIINTASTRISVDAYINDTWTGWKTVTLN